MSNLKVYKRRGPDERAEDGFGMLYVQSLQGLTPREMLVYASLVSHISAESPHPFPSNEKIEFDTGIRDKDIGAIKTSLQKKGMIEFAYRHPLYGTDAYRIYYKNEQYTGNSDEDIVNKVLEYRYKVLDDVISVEMVPSSLRELVESGLTGPELEAAVAENSAKMPNKKGSLELIQGDKPKSKAVKPRSQSSETESWGGGSLDSGNVSPSSRKDVPNSESDKPKGKAEKPESWGPKRPFNKPDNILSNKQEKREESSLSLFEEKTPVQKKVNNGDVTVYLREALKGTQIGNQKFDPSKDGVYLSKIASACNGDFDLLKAGIENADIPDKGYLSDHCLRIVESIKETEMEAQRAPFLKVVQAIHREDEDSFDYLNEFGLNEPDDWTAEHNQFMSYAKKTLPPREYLGMVDLFSQYQSAFNLEGAIKTYLI